MVRGALLLLALAACGGEPAPSGDEGPVHPAGILDATSPDFHGARLRELTYEVEVCGDCHGADLRGSDRGPSCFGCHAEGPMTCDTCHAALGGAHAVHLAPPRALAADCGWCHVQPTLWREPGHLFLEDGSVDPPPSEIRLGPRASRGLAEGAVWDAEAGTCLTYCHGDAFDDASATRPARVWWQPGEAACGGCHGVPPASHPAGREDCALCHAPAVTADGPVSSLHVDGTVQAGE